jgi:lysophospholipase L1-like esterase
VIPLASSGPLGVRRLAGLTAALATCALALPGAASAATRTASPAATTFSGGYVAMGDSYTSGPGIATATSDSGACTRSDHNYPHLIAAAIDPTSFKDVSCSGATTDGITGSQSSQPAQLDAVDSTTRLVTVGIGGNDAGLIGGVATCVALSILDSNGSPCKSLNNGGTANDSLVKSINDAQPKIKSTLLAIKQKAPNARVILVGYPDLAPSDKSKCAPGVDLPIATGDVPYLYGINALVNQVWASTATAAGVEYVDTYTPGQGHDVCQLVGTRWVEGITNITNGGPIHPNGDGMQAFANLVEAKLGT